MGSQDKGSQLLSSTCGNGTFVITVTSPNVTLWSLPDNVTVSGQPPYAVRHPRRLRLYINASVEWYSCGAGGHVAAIHKWARREGVCAHALAPGRAQATAGDCATSPCHALAWDGSCYVNLQAPAGLCCCLPWLLCRVHAHACWGLRKCSVHRTRLCVHGQLGTIGTTC